MAAGEGFEPSQTESESGVLPLHKPAICLAPKRMIYYMRFFENVKVFFIFFLYFLLIFEFIFKAAP